MVASVDERIALLERDLLRMSDRLARVERELGSFPRPTPERAVAEVTRTPDPTEAASRLPGRPAVSPPAPRGTALDLEELLGGRLLALLGGLAVLVGLAFLVVLAMERGWIDERARTLVAFLGSGGLLVLGAWLHERRGRTQASLAMVGTAVAGLYLSVTAATALYDLVPAAVGLAVALAVGAVATVLALRWNSREVAGLGIVGALAGPLFAGSFPSVDAVAFLAIAHAAAAAVLAWRRWEGIRVVAFALATGQVSAWAVLGDQSTALTIAALALFGLLNLATTLGHELRLPGAALRAPTAFLVGASALVLGGTGHVVLVGEYGAQAAGLWMAGVAIAHLAGGVAAFVVRRIGRHVGLVLLGVALTSANVAFALLVDGQALAIGWAASAALLAGVVRRVGGVDEIVPLTAGAQLALATGHVLLFDAAPGTLVTEGGVSFAPLVAVALSAFACGRLARADEGPWRVAADGLAALALAYSTALALDGTALVVTWAGEAAALAEIARRTRDGAARAGATAFAALAAVHALAFEAPPTALVYGVDSLSEAALALAAVAATVLRVRGARPSDRAPFELAVGGLAVYLASVAIVSAFQPGALVFDTGLHVDVRQQGQAVLSAFWSMTGLALLSLGLRSGVRRVRLAGLALLSVAVAKVFVFDLATLEAEYRVLSFVVVGLLLLAGAYAYQRVRRTLPEGVAR